uniref:Uncharacterized protein n=1 Tax=Anopheles minimus TaxID=112268 RepID=A0A182WH13_9DIPT
MCPSADRRTRLSSNTSCDVVSALGFHQWLRRSSCLQLRKRPALHQRKGKVEEAMKREGEKDKAKPDVWTKIPN